VGASERLGRTHVILRGCSGKGELTWLSALHISGRMSSSSCALCVRSSCWPAACPVRKPGTRRQPPHKWKSPAATSRGQSRMIQTRPRSADGSSEHRRRSSRLSRAEVTCRSSSHDPPPSSTGRAWAACYSPEQFVASNIPSRCSEWRTTDASLIGRTPQDATRPSDCHRMRRSTS
jgi:hypothetical protein